MKHLNPRKGKRPLELHPIYYSYCFIKIFYMFLKEDKPKIKKKLFDYLFFEKILSIKKTTKG